MSPLLIAYSIFAAILIVGMVIDFALAQEPEAMTLPDYAPGAADDAAMILTSVGMWGVAGTFAVSCVAWVVG